MQACHRAFDGYDDADQFAEMRRAAMARYFGWSGAVAKYEALYRRLIGPRAPETARVPHDGHRWWEPQRRLSPRPDANLDRRRTPEHPA